MRPLLLPILFVLLCGCASPSPLPLPPTLPPSVNSLVATTAPSQSTAASAPVTITFAVNQYELAKYRPLADRFEAEQPDVTVQIIALPEPAKGPDGTLQFAGFQRQVAETADSFSTSFAVDEALRAGLLLDLTPLIDADPSFDRADFLPGALNPVDGAIGSITHNLFVPLYAYNRILFTQRGVTEPTADISFAQLLDKAKQVAVAGDDSSAIYGIWNYEIALDTLTMLLRERGIDLGDTAPPLSDERYAATLAELQTLAAENTILYENWLQRSSVVNDIRSHQLTGQSQLAIWPAQDYGFPAGSLPADVGLVPMRDPATDALQLFPYNSYGISAGTQHPEAAWRWISFLSRQYLPLDSGNFGFFPARRSLLVQHWQSIGESEIAVMRPIIERLEVPPQLTASPMRWALQSGLSAAAEQLLGQRQSVPTALAAAETAAQEAVLTASIPTPTPDMRPIIVSTPQPVPALAGAKEVRFGVPPLLGESIRATAGVFNQSQSAIAVTATTIDGSADSSPGGVAAQFDCFVTRAYEPADDATLDLQPLIDADPRFNVGDYPPVLLEQLREGGKLTALPLTMEMPLIVYNTQLFAEAGIAPPRASWTLDDFISAAEQLTTGSGAKRRYGLGVVDGGLLLFFLERSRVELVHEDRQTIRPQFTDPVVEMALQRFVTVVKQTVPSARLSGYSANPADPVATEAIQSGRVAMWLGTTTNLPYAEGSALPVRVTPLPLVDGKLSGVGVNYAFYIAAGNSQPEACWRWFAALSRDADVGGVRELPARLSLLDTAAAHPGIPAGTAELIAAYRNALAASVPAGTTSFEPIPFNSFWLLRAVDRALQGRDLDSELVDAQFLTEQYMNCVGNGGEAITCARTADPTYVMWGEQP